jgi:3-hydroxy-3-methylglutaryl CoA synthase
MPYVASIGTYLPCWGAPQHRVAGDDEDAITLAVEAGRAALIASGAVERVVLVSRNMPLKVKGHPPGATGVAQCVELFAQLRGEAANQVDGARVALAHNIGGPTAVSAVTILEGSASGTG